MGLFHHESDHAQAYEEVVGVAEVGPEHKAKWSHELIASAAAFEAAKAYEQHKAKNGNPSNHAQAKEILAGLTGFAVDRLVETKGLDFIDKQKAKHHAKKEAEDALANSGEY